MIRTPLRICSLAGVLSACLLISGCGRTKQTPLKDPLMDVFRRQEREEGLSRQQTVGKQLFGHYCVTCHGEQGEGDGQNAYNLDPAPPNFKESLELHPPSYWSEIIKGGTAAVGRSPLCPPWGHALNSQQIDAIVSYMKVLSKPPEKPTQSSPDSSQAK